MKEGGQRNWELEAGSCTVAAPVPVGSSTDNRVAAAWLMQVVVADKPAADADWIRGCIRPGHSLEADCPSRLDPAHRRGGGRPHSCASRTWAETGSGFRIEPEAAGDKHSAVLAGDTGSRAEGRAER